MNDARNVSRPPKTSYPRSVVDACLDHEEKVLHTAEYGSGMEDGLGQM